MSAATNGGIHLTAEKAKAILGEILAALQDQRSGTQLQEARDTAGSDMLKMMQHVFPACAEIQMDVIKNHGYSRDGKGAVQFTKAVKSLAKENAEIAALYDKLHAYFVPPMIPAAASSVVVAAVTTEQPQQQ